MFSKKVSFIFSMSRSISFIFLLALISWGSELEITNSNVDSLANSNTTFLIKTSVTLTGDKTIAASSSLRFSNGGVIDVGTHNLTINGGIEAGFYQIFIIDNGSYSGYQVRGNPKIQYTVPQWFKGVNTAWHNAFQAAVGLIPSTGGTLYLPSDTYYVNSTVFIPYKGTDTSYTDDPQGDPNYTFKKVNIIGDGPENSVISLDNSSGNFPAFRLNSRNDNTPLIPYTYSNFILKGFGIFKTDYNCTGIYGLIYDGCIFEDLRFHGLRYGIKSQCISKPSWDSSFAYYQLIILRKVSFETIFYTCFDGGCYNDAIVVENCNTISFNRDGNQIRNGFIFHSGTGISIIGGVYNECDTPFVFDKCNSINISGIYCEGNNKQIFDLNKCSNITIQNSHFDIHYAGNQKLINFLDTSKNIQMIGNNIRVANLSTNGIYNNWIFSGDISKCVNQIVFLGNGVGSHDDSHYNSELTEYDLQPLDKKLFRICNTGYKLNINTALDLSSNVISNVASPVVNSDASTKGYVDSIINTIVPASAGGWTKNGQVVSLTTGSDNVGISTTSPGAKLDVNGNIKVNSQLIYNDGSNPQSTVKLYNTTSGAMEFNTGYGQAAAGGFSFNTGNGVGNVMTIKGDGKIGIGVATPGAKLDINGDIKATTANIGNISSTGSVGIGITSPGSNLQVSNNAAIGYANSTSAPACGLVVGGSIGVGTTTPNTKLDINGGVSFRDSSANISGRVDNFFPGSYSILRVSGTSNPQITGISGGAVASRKGKVLWIINNGSMTITIPNNSSYSADTNKILTYNANPITIAQNASAMLWYDANTDTKKWRLMK